MPSVDLIRYRSKGCIGETAKGSVGDAATMPLTGRADWWGEKLGAPMTWLLYQALAPVLSRAVGTALRNNLSKPRS
jgi:hypothetical protein